MSRTVQYKEQIGVMDRRIKIQRPEITRTASGAETATWIDYSDVWAMIEWRTLSNDESATAGFDMPTQYVAITIRAIKELTTKWQVIYRDEVYDIIFIEEQGRNNRMVLRCQLRKES